jgi:hypothetical protein
VPFVGLAGLVCASIIPSYTLIEETAPGHRGRTDAAEAALAQRGWKPLLSYLCTVQMLTFFIIQFCATLCRGGQERGTLNLYAAYAFDMGPKQLGLLNTVAMVFALPVLSLPETLPPVSSGGNLLWGTPTLSSSVVGIGCRLERDLQMPHGLCGQPHWGCLDGSGHADKYGVMVAWPLGVRWTPFGDTNTVHNT